MAQRNPLNDRYQNDKPAGKTRKSAGRAKPAKEPATPTRGRQMDNLSEREKAERKREKANVQRRMKADAQRTMTKEERKAQREKELEERRERDRMITPDTPEYKLWRRVWLGLLAFAVVGIAVAWFTRAPMEEAGLPMWLQYIPIVLSYAAILGALAIDFIKIRPLRRPTAAQSKGEKKSKEKSKTMPEKNDKGDDE